MAKTEEKATEVLVVKDLRQLNRTSTAEEMKQLRKNPLDKAKKPGGYFVTIDGKAHDAEGNEVPIEPEDLEHVKELRALRGLPELGSEEAETGVTEGGTEADLESMSVADLKALAGERNVTVEGKKGKAPVKADYVKALGG